MPPITQATRARQLARAIASDIALYQEAQVEEGIVQDTFFQVLGPALDEGLKLYRQRVDPAIDEPAAHFWHAVIDIILLSKAHLTSPMW